MSAKPQDSPVYPPPGQDPTGRPGGPPPPPPTPAIEIPGSAAPDAPQTLTDDQIWGDVTDADQITSGGLQSDPLAGE